MENQRIKNWAIKFASEDYESSNVNIYHAKKKGYAQGAIDQIAFIQTEITKLKLDTPTTRGIAYNEALIDVLKILAI